MAFPKKKRQRMTNEDDDKMDIVDDDVNGASVTATIKQQISCKDVLTKTLIDQLESELGNNKDTTASISTSSDDDAASISLLRLKSFQRKILEKLRRSQKILAQQAEARNKQELQLENLRYQHELNEESQRRSSGEIGTTEIVRLVRRTASDEGEDSTVLLQNYLGKNWNDLAQRPMIVAKLNLEVATRKNLEQQLRRVQQDRTSKLESLATKQKLLKDLPTKLADMEKASLSLQTFCQKSSSSSVKMDVTPKLGTKRRNRLDLAKTLPKALYTVYHQLQSSLDVMATAVTTMTTDDTTAEISSETIPIVDILTSETDSTTDFVVLKIPIPTVSDGGILNFRPKKSASVTFEYDDRSGMVLARCGSDYDMGKYVIDELFPGDTGEWTGERNFSNDECNDEAGTTNTQNDNSSKDSARAYQWCNYLGGLHIAPREQTAAKMHCSTKVITKALVRRVRATATISWILHSLSRKPHPFPIHSAMKSLWFDDDENKNKESLPSTKLSSWIIVDGNQVSSSSTPLLSSTKNNDNIRVYEAVLKCNSSPDSSSKTLTARVCINVARYPSIIPRWTILSSSSKSIQGEEDSLEVLKGEQMPLYNESLARLEKHVNRDVDQLVLSSDQTTYDWVLAQQLFEIGRGWEEMLLSNNA
jgi:hypothetical protein